MTPLRARLLLPAVALILIPVLVRAAEPRAVTWKVDGDERQALVYAPPVRSAKLPLVFAFHGRGDNMRNFAEGVELHKAWPEAIVVYIDGLKSTRASGMRGWQNDKGQDGDRDLKLFDQALAWLRQNYPVDDARIYSTGFSNGAIFTYLLWAERGQTFAAFAPVAGRIGPSLTLTVPRPLLHVAGKEDDTVKFKTQVESIQAARELNGAAKKGQPCGSNCTLYASSKNAPVMAVIHSGGHEYPDGTSAMIVKFSKAHPLEDRAGSQ